MTHVAITTAIIGTRGLKTSSRWFQVGNFIELAQIPFMAWSYMSSMRLKAAKYFFSSARNTDGVRLNRSRNTAVCECQNLTVSNSINNYLFHANYSVRDDRAGQLPVPHG